MLFTYRSTLVDRDNRRATNTKTTIDTEQWLDVMRRDPRRLYGNSADLVQQHVLPLLETNKLDELSATVYALYEQWRERNGTAIFELAMYVWAGHKAGRYSADVWATILAIAWQSGARGMMAATVLTQAQVIEMFKAAPRPTLLRMGESVDCDLNKEFEELPDSFQVFRGMSTGISHFENGFSWTLDPEQMFTFAALNCQNKKEIPGFVLAVIPKEAVLAMFSYEREVVVDPTVAKLEVQKHFLRGKELRDFHKKIDVAANTEDIMFNTGYHANRKAAHAAAMLDAEKPNYVTAAANAG